MNIYVNSLPHGEDSRIAPDNTLSKFNALGSCCCNSTGKLAQSIATEVKRDI
jgi:hypothetical protein